MNSGFRAGANFILWAGYFFKKYAGARRRSYTPKMMRPFLIAGLLMFQTTLWAQVSCQNAPANSSCQEIVVPQPVGPKNGKCAGLLNGRFVCVVNFNVDAKESLLELNCSNFLGRPFLVEKLIARAQTYKQLGVIVKEDGTEDLIQDSLVYTNLSNDQFILHLEEDSRSLIVQRRGTMHLALFGSMRSLDNVVCE